MADRVRAEEANGSGGVATATMLAELALAPSTRDRYARGLRSLDDWRGDRPETDETLAAYVSAVFDRGLAPNTAAVAVAAAAERAGRLGLRCPVGPETRAALAGFRRHPDAKEPQQVAGIRWEQADRMAEVAEALGTVGGLRDALLVRVMSDCLLRASEASALNLAEIAFVDDWLAVTIRRSKTDQEGEGVVLYAGPETARVARAWLETAAVGGGALFRPVDKAGRVSAARLGDLSVREIVKRRAADIGIGERVSGHSLRVGTAQSLRDAGATLSQIMSAGRWKRLDTMARYTSVQDAATGPVAQLRYGVVPRDGRTPPALADEAAKRVERAEAMAAEAAREVKRLRKAARRQSKEVKELRKGVARLEKAVVGSMRADSRNQSQPVDFAGFFSGRFCLPIADVVLPADYVRTLNLAGATPQCLAIARAFSTHPTRSKLLSMNQPSPTSFAFVKRLPPCSAALART